MLLSPQLKMFAGISGIDEEIAPNFPGSSAFPMPTWDLPSPPAPREHSIHEIIGEESSAVVSISCCKPASQERWVCQGKGQENQNRAGFATAVNQKENPSGWPFSLVPFHYGMDLA